MKLQWSSDLIFTVEKIRRIPKRRNARRLREMLKLWDVVLKVSKSHEKCILLQNPVTSLSGKKTLELRTIGLPSGQTMNVQLSETKISEVEIPVVQICYIKTVQMSECPNDQILMSK